MNNLGFSNDSVNIGDFRIKGQNETLIIGNENGGDGYILPTEKGTEGQVITMNADNSTSFQDASQGLTGRIIKNLFVMREKTNFYNTLPTSAQALFQTGYGSNVVDIANFPVNSTIHIYSRGVIDFDASVVASGTGVFQLEVDDGAGNVARFTSNNLTLSKQGTANQNRFYQVDYIFQRTADNSYKFDGYGLVSDGSDGQIKMGYTEQNFVPTIPYTQFTIKATYYKIVSTPGEEYIPLASVYINNLILDSSLLIDPPPAPTSHTALTDLTAGDAGHTQFALLGGRSGGQILSGGITPANFLTLKSHTAGLNNIVVKDLNTSFEKNIDMNNNAINNVLNINSTTNINLNPSGNVDINGDVDMGSNRILGVLEIVGDGGDMTIRNGGGESILLNSVTNTIDILNNNLNMNNNSIDNVSVVNNGLGPLALIGSSLSSSVVIDPDPANSVVIGGPNDVVVSSNNDVNIISNAGIVNVNSNITNVNVGGTPRLTIDASEVGIGNTLNLNTNDITNGNFINANKIFCGDYETTTGFISFFGLGGIIPSFNSGGLDMNNGAVNSVSSINGLTPVGGLFSGTSDSLNVSATTAEISILPLTFVGVGFGVPPNGFSVGDCFLLNLSGPFNSNNNDTLTIRLKGGPTSTTILSTLVVPLNASSGSVFQLSVLFQIRAIGGAGVADIVSDADLTYNQSGAGGSFVGEQSLSQNNTTFATDVANILDVTAQFSSNSANNDMTTRVSKLQKTY